MVKARRGWRVAVAVAVLSGAGLDVSAVPAGEGQGRPAGQPQSTWFGKASGGGTQTFKDPDGRFTFEFPKKDWMALPVGGPIVATVASKKGDAAIVVEHGWLKQPLAPSDITDLFAELEVEVIRERVPKATDFQTQIIDAGDQRIVAVQYVRQGLTGMERVRQVLDPRGQASVSYFRRRRAGQLRFDRTLVRARGGDLRGERSQRVTSTDLPAKFGRYEVLERVGRGGMGMVYRGRDTVLEREVAIKVMSGDFTEDETARTRFYREARAAAKLQHRNIVTIFEFGEEDGTPYIVMEFLNGQDLARRIRQEPPLTLEQKLEVMAELCTGLHFAHEQGVVHRDVKPANVWLLPDGTIKLLDFGIAKVASSTMTRQGAVFGSASYMAPEQVTGSPVDARSDVFSIGVVLYELVSGRKPFEADSPTAILVKIMDSEPAPLDQIVPDLPRPLIAAINRALQKDPAKRYQRAADLAADLRVIRSNLQTGTPMPSGDIAETFFTTRSAPTDTGPVGAANLTLDRGGDSGLGRPSSTRWWIPVAALAGMAAVVGVVLITFRAPAPAGDSAAGTPGVAPPGASGAPSSPAPAVSARTLKVTSKPSGAAIQLNGTDTGKLTPADLSTAGEGPHRIRLTRRGSQPVEVTLTPSDVARGSIDLELASAPVQPSSPSAPASPPTPVVFAGTYPFELLEGDRVVSPPAERHETTINARRVFRMRASAYFLDRQVVVEALGRPLELSAPELGKLTIRSSFGGCPVLLNGHSLGYLPINDVSVAAGTYRLEQQCPDGGGPLPRTITVLPGESNLATIR